MNGLSLNNCSLPEHCGDLECLGIECDAIVRGCILNDSASCGYCSTTLADKCSSLWQLRMFNNDWLHMFYTVQPISHLLACNRYPSWIT